MSLVEASFKDFHVRPSAEFAQWLKAYMGIHKIDSKTNAIELMWKELVELKEKQKEAKQELKPNGAGAGLNNSLGIQLSEREKRSLFMAQKKEEIKTQEMAKRRGLGSFRGPRIDFPMVEGPRRCPRNYSVSKCFQFPCDRRPQCKQEGII